MDDALRVRREGRGKKYKNGAKIAARDKLETIMLRHAPAMLTARTSVNRKEIRIDL